MKVFLKYKILASVIVLALAIFFTGSFVLNPNSNQTLKHYEFNEGINLAKAKNKKVLIDVYTDWCVWCKKMDKDTYSDSAVKKEIGRNFIFVKMNAESNDKVEYKGKSLTKAQLSAAFGVNGYPATVFLDEKGNYLTLLPGYFDAKQFRQILKFIGDDIYQKKSFQDFIKDEK